MRTGNGYQIVVGKKSPPPSSRGLRFLRGRDFEARLPAGEQSPTSVATPLEASVVARLSRAKKRPLEHELVSVEVYDGQGTNATVRSGAETVQLELTARGGKLFSKKKLLFWHGARGDLGGASWPDIQLLEVTASGDVPFEAQVAATCGDAQGTLGLFDVLAEDPESPGTFRTLRHGLFRSRTPRLRICSGGLETAQLRFVLDDGAEETDDELDFTGLLAGQDTIELPPYARLGSGGVTGKVNQRVGRRRLVQESVEEAPAEGDCALFLHGENRLRVETGGAPIFVSRSFHYTADEQTVPGGWFQPDEVEVEGARLRVIRGSLTLDFRDAATDAQVSRALHALRARPRSFAGRYNVVEAHFGEEVKGAKLTDLCREVKGLDDPDIEAVGFAPLLVPALSSVQERLPQPLLGDFAVATHTFNNADDHWHHFVIHSFPAHRLIESRLFPDQRPPQVAVAGARFETNKSFIRPEAQDELRRIRELNDQEPDRKIAIFGHTDRVGADASNNDLSRARAGSMNALLRHDEGFWYDHFAVHERLGNGTPEVKFALRDLGQFAGPIDGTASPQLDAAVDAFKAANGLGGTGLTAATRQAIGEALLQKIGATFAPLRNEAAWGVREIQSMLTLLGHYTGPINGVNTAATQTAVRAFQASEGLTQDGSVGLVTRIALIRRYQGRLFATALAADRFHAGAVFGCGEAFPIVPTPDNVESAQNRRVEVIFRRTPVTPIDPNQVGAAVPFLQWTAPEFDGAPPAEPPKVVVAITDTGFGRSSPADNFSGEQGKLPNDLLIKGERLLRPTDTSGANAGNPTLQTVSPDGNLQNVGDVTALGGGAPPGGGHGSAVMTCLGADGVGSPVGGLPRTARNTVLGTAPHVHIRPIRISAAGGGANFFSYLLGLEAIANDPEVLVHTTSIADWVASLSFTPAQLRAFQERAQEMVMQGKLMFSVPQNYNGGAFPPNYWAGTTQWGRLGPDKRNARSTNSGVNEFRRRLEIVGATARVGRAPAGGALTVNLPGQQEIIADFSFVGEQVGIFMPGSQIRAVMPSAAALIGALGSPVPIAAQNVTVGGIDGTSFATPMTAGVAAELMLLDPDLRQAANVARVLEYMEATADPLPNVNPAGGTGAPANQRVNDPTIAGNAAHPSFSGIRRLHFWKGVLAALNKGLSAETRGAAGAQDPFFTFCTLRDDASTEFYGFEIRSPVPDATVWLRKASGEIVPAQDAGAVFPAGRTSASCWRTVDALQLGPNQPLPAFPWPAATFPAGRRVFFLCQFSIAKALLAQFQSLVLHLPAADPRQPGGADSPPLLDLRVDDRPTMRNPGAIPPGAPAPQLALKTFVQAFDDFVFHLAAVPQPLASFVLFAQGHRTGLGVGETVTVFVFAADGFGNLTDPGALAVNVTHNGTPGSAAPVAGVFLGGAPAAAAGVPLAFGAGGDPRGMARVQFQGNTAENVTLSVNDGAGHAGSVIIQVAAAGAVSSLQLEVRRRGGGASVVAQPAFAGEPIELAVRAVDANGRVRADFTGDVRLRVLQGETGSDGPPPARGVHVKLNDADPFSAAAFHHVFSAADAGQHVFPLFCYTTGALQLEASGGGASGQSESIGITAGPVASFAAQASAPQTAGKRFELVLTAMDAHQNRAERFAGQVTISLAAGTAGVAGPPPDGAFIGDTALVGDDTVSFAQADAGVLRVPVTCFRAENVTFRVTHNPPGGGAAIVSTSSPIQIQAAGALHHFRFEITGAGRAGSAFTLRVIAEDAAGSRLTGFAGNVQIALVAGTAFNAAPRRGVLIETAPGVAGNAHVFAAADAGAFTFRITPFTAEAVTLSASDGAAVTTNTPALAIRAGLFTQFAVLPAGGARRNVPFAVRVEARDAFNNVVLDFLGQVNLLVNPGTGAFAPVAGPTGQHPFAVADAGVHVFNLTVATSGAGHQVRATDGNVAGTSAAFNVAP